MLIGEEANQMRALTPTGDLGYRPFHTTSFHLGLDTKPDLICADAGSCDPGPAPLATGGSTSSLIWERHDLAEMLSAARRLRIPMIVSSPGDSGANSHVDRFVQLVREIAEEQSLGKFKLGYFYSDVDKDYLSAKIQGRDAITGLDARGDLTASELAATDNIVAVAGVHPYRKLLDDGADVIIGGRSGDCAPYAALAIQQGYPEGLAYYLGRVMESSSMAAEPYRAMETVIGEISHDDVCFTPLNPEQRCTVKSVRGITIFERPDPYFEYTVGGALDMSRCVYEQVNERTTRVRGAAFIEASELRVKLEGARKIGETFMAIVGVRDPYVLASLDAVVGWASGQVRDQFPREKYELFFHRFGQNGVLQRLEPRRSNEGNVVEVGIVIEAVAGSADLAREVCKSAMLGVVYAPPPSNCLSKPITHRASRLVDEVLPAGPACEWTVNHTVRVDGPLELFKTFITSAGI